MTASAPPSARTFEALDAGEVHGDGGDVAEEAHARAVGGDVDVLADVGAVEVQRVVAALALDGVAAVARIPLEVVVAGAQLGGVGADVAVDEVVAGAADEHVVAVAAGERVVAGAAVDREAAERRDAVAATDHVVAAAGLHVDRREGCRVEAEGERAVDRHLQSARCPELQGERVARRVAGDLQRSRLHLRGVGG